MLDSHFPRSSILSLPFRGFAPAWFLAAAMVFFLMACGDSSPGTEYSFTRTVQEPAIVRSCADSQADLDCYVLRWRHPMDTRNLVRYHVWVDTLSLPYDALDVTSAQRTQSIKRDYVERDGVELDSLDLSAELTPYLERDSVVIAIWAEYNDQGIAGSIQRLSAFFGDNLPPIPPRWSAEVGPDSFFIEWLRPTDQRDFYRPELSNGPIAGYNIEFNVDRGGAQYNTPSLTLRLYLNGQEIPDALFQNSRYRNYGDGAVLDTGLTQDTAGLRLLLAVRDGHGFNADSSDANRFQLIVSGLPAESRHQVRLFAYDSAGNSVQAEGPVGSLVALTDSIRPLMASRFWVAQDTLAGGGFQLDSNRLILFWPMAVDPVRQVHGIRLDTVLSIPSACQQGPCWRGVASYQVETFVRGQWVAAVRAGGLVSERYQQRFRIQEGVAVPDSAGLWHGDTLRWVAPGDTLMLRVRAVDPSGYASPWLQDTLHISAGELAALGCPAGMVGVRRRLGGDTTLPQQFCMGRFEQHDSAGNFVRGALWSQAVQSCRDLQVPGFRTDLCAEDDWLSACLTRRSVDFGVIQEPPFYAQEFLFQHCNVGTGDSAGTAMGMRSPRCVSPDGVHDLPGQLQEWVRGARVRLDSLDPRDTLGIDTIPMLKGSSYRVFETSDWTRLARCTSRSLPYRERPGFTRDTVWLYRNGTRLDTLFAQDTSRIAYGILPPGSFADTVQFYEVRAEEGGEVLGEDFVDLREYRRRGAETWLAVLADGLEYTPSRREVVFLRGTQKWPGSEQYYRDNSIGQRCCAYPLAP